MEKYLYVRTYFWSPAMSYWIEILLPHVYWDINNFLNFLIHLDSIGCECVLSEIKK